MPLVQNRTASDYVLAESTTAGTTAVYAIAPTAGMIVAVFGAPATAQASTVTVAINGTTVAAMGMTLAATAWATTEVDMPLAGASAVYVNAGDVISFTGTGAAGAAYTVIVRAFN